MATYLGGEKIKVYIDGKKRSINVPDVAFPLTGMEFFSSDELLLRDANGQNLL